MIYLRTRSRRLHETTLAHTCLRDCGVGRCMRRHSPALHQTTLSLTCLCLARLYLRTRVEAVGSDRHGSLYWCFDDAIWACNDKWLAHAPPATTHAHADGEATSIHPSSSPYLTADSLNHTLVPPALGRLDPSTPTQGVGGRQGGGLRCHKAVSAAGGGWRCYKAGPSVRRLMAFLNPQGPREGLLLDRLQRFTAVTASTALSPTACPLSFPSAFLNTSNATSS
jgi:hypothetical protein